MSGFVYFIVPEDDEFMKIGFAADVESRIAQLQTGNPRRLQLVAAVSGTLRLEQEFHRIMRPYRTSGEWYKLEGAPRKLLTLLEAGARPNTAAHLESLLSFDDGVAWINEGAGRLAKVREAALPHIQRRLARKS